jgi:hypothetical protein
MKWHSLFDVLVGQTQRRVVDHVDVNFTLALFQIQSLSLSLSLGGVTRRGVVLTYLLSLVIGSQ